MTTMHNNYPAPDPWILLDTLPEGVLVLDANQTIIYRTIAWEQIHQANEQVLEGIRVGKPYCTGFAEAIGPTEDEREHICRGLRAVLDGASNEFTFEYQVKKRPPDQEPGLRWVRVRATALPTPAGKPRQLMLLHEEVTEQKEADETSHTIEATLGAVFYDSLDIILIGDGRSGRILNVSPIVHHVLGYRASELIGHHFSVLFPQESEGELSDIPGQIQAHGAVLEAQPFLHADGSIVPMDLTVTMIPLSQGVAMLATLRDARERRESEVAREQQRDELEMLVREQVTQLSESEQALGTNLLLLQGVLDHSPTAIFAKDRQGRFILTSRKAEALFRSGKGTLQGSLLGKTDYDFLPEALANTYLAQDEQVFSTARPLEVEEIVQYEGETRAYQTIKFPIYNTEGHIYALGGIVTDTTEQHTLREGLEQRVAERTAELSRMNNLLKQEVEERVRAETALTTERASLARQVQERTADLRLANARLERAARLKDEFLASMSHELRTPLNAILGLSEALQEQVYGSMTEKQLTILRSIEESGRHLLSLINDILDLAKIESGKTELTLDYVPVASLCQASLRLIRNQAQKKHQHLMEHIDRTVTSLRADERRLKQMLVNLLSNAVKFTPQGGEIGLRVVGDHENQAVSFVVYDNGIGISPDDMNRLFKPFVQIDSSLSRHHEGTGLGLALVARLAEMHNGSVTVESEIGQGSRFTISLPWIEPPPATTAPADTSRAKTGQLRQSLRRALIIEDSASAAEQFGRYLNEIGVEYAISATGEDATQKAKELQAEVIILDILLPTLSGWDILTSLKASPLTRDIPVILISVVDDQPHGTNLGAAAYLVKPITRQQFYTALGSIFSHLDLPNLAPETKKEPERQETRILLAEDNPDNIAMLMEYLQMRGYQVVVAHNGLEALEHARREHPDLILMDIQMPAMDGLEATRRIRAEPGLETMPIIALTALAMPGDRERCLEAGANDYMSKPVRLRKLVQMIEAHLSTPSGPSQHPQASQHPRTSEQGEPPQ
jgi:PAS domain S-box-containing protein